VAAAILGFFVNNVFNNQSIYALFVGGVSMIIAGFLNLIVKDSSTDAAEKLLTI
jgi:maltose/moltooligosaccharide transporter